MAQEAGAQADAPGAADIIVTAQKRSERLIDTPVPITAISADNLVAQNDVGIADYVTRVPGLSLNKVGGGQVGLSIRGISTGSGNNPTVGVVIDDVPVGASVAVASGGTLVPELDPSQLDRIEVLKGPQGTLYGAASLGGLLKYVTKAPSTTTTFGQVQVDGSLMTHGDQGFGVRGGVNLPVIDEKLGVGISAFYRRDPGFVDDPAHSRESIDSSQSYGGRVAALVKPVDHVSIRLSALLQGYKTDGSAQVTGDQFSRPTNGLTNDFLPGAGRTNRRFELYSAAIDVDLGGATLTSLTALGYNRFYNASDSSAQFGKLAPLITGDPADESAKTLSTVTTRKFTQELRLASARGGTLEWLVGGFYTHEKSALLFHVVAADNVTGNPLGDIYPDNIFTTYGEYAVFGTATLNLSKSLSIQGGIRHSRNRQSYDEYLASPIFPYEVHAHSRDSATTFLITPQFHLTRDIMLYARIASGYRPGGPNPGAGVGGFPQTFAADKTINYELGWKGSVLNRKLTFDLSVFAIDWKDIQLSIIDPVTFFTYYTNGAKARSRGAELTVTVNPWHGMTVSGNIAYTDAQLRSPLATGTLGDPGDPLPYVAKWAGSLAVDQDFELGDDKKAFVGATFGYNGNRLSDFQGGFDPALKALRLPLPKYTTLDLRAGLTFSDWTLSAFVKNATDSRGVVGSNYEDVATRRSNVFFVRPRTVGLSVQKTF